MLNEKTTELCSVVRWRMIYLQSTFLTIALLIEDAAFTVGACIGSFLFVFVSVAISSLTERNIAFETKQMIVIIDDSDMKRVAAAVVTNGNLRWYGIAVRGKELSIN